MASISLDYLLPYLRLRIGDTDSTSYRYLDDWLQLSLVLAVKNLERYWNFKYLVNDADNTIYRNSSSGAFIIPEEYGIVQHSDENIIVLMAAIIILEGSLENSAWDAVSWKDAEISFSNLEKYRSRDAGIKRLLDELNLLIKPPTKRLAWTTKQSLPGFKDNRYETEPDV